MLKDLIGLGGQVGSYFFSSIQSSIAGLIDNKDIASIFSTTLGAARKIINTELITQKIADLQLQTSTYGKVIPMVFGRTRMAGNMIWCSTIVTKKTTYANIPVLGKMVEAFGLPGSTVIIRGSFAIGLCKGVIDSVSAIYADDIAVNMSGLEYIVYNGTEDQMPNSTIQSYVGIENTPAFRGIAYIVFINFPLEKYNGRIPNLTFDVIRYRDIRSKELEDISKLVTGITIIPGTGEFVYDTNIQHKYDVQYFGKTLARISKNTSINNNTIYRSKTDFVVSLDQLKLDLPNIKWVAITVCWFTDSMNIKDAYIYPAIEVSTMASEPDPWRVSSWNRLTATVVLNDENNRPIYGGTISDAALLNGLKELKSRGYKVCLYPMLQVNLIGKPWRGMITGEASDVKQFFERQYGYNEFIQHYATLTKEYIDALVIGTELIGITKIKTPDNTFLGVDELVSLAEKAKYQLGNKIKVIYAADWSEYHHTSDGWFNLDKLWASPAIDVIGIDAYFPLTHSAISIYEESEIMKGWTSGEGYDFYYEDKLKTKKVPIEARYAWKNISYFWENKHVNPDGKETDWIPKMKKIWFTEYGFPSVDCSTNEPNVFFSEDSTNAGFPIMSQGQTDFRAQRVAITATEKYWKNSEMVEQKFLWTWDARPYPYFPSAKEVWSDGASWKKGHFIQGKIEFGTLGDIIMSLCKQVGFKEEDVDTVLLTTQVDGYVISSKANAISHIVLLSNIFGFDAFVEDGVLRFKPFTNFVLHNISTSEILMQGSNILFQKEESCSVDDFPDTVEVLFRNLDDNYKIATIRVSEANPSETNVESISLGVAVNTKTATNIAKNILLAKNMRKSYYKVSLPIRYAEKLRMMDIVSISDIGDNEIFRIDTMEVQRDFALVIGGWSDDPNAYRNDFRVADISSPVSPGSGRPVPETNIEVIDGFREHNKDEKPFVYIGIYSNSNYWSGCGIFYSEDKGITYKSAAVVDEESVIGVCLNKLSSQASQFLVDDKSILEVVIHGGNSELLFSVSEEDFINCVNLAIVGQEIVAFREVKMTGKNTFAISGFIRGRNGTEEHIITQKEKQRFVLLNRDNLIKVSFLQTLIGREIIVKAQSNGQSFEEASTIKFILNSNAITDLQPINITQVKNNNDFTINWIPRPGSEEYFFEEPESKNNYRYNIIICDQLGNQIRKIFAENTSTATYTEAMQIEDFKTNVNEIRIV